VTSVHVIARDNAAGLSRDLGIVADNLTRAGFDVTVSALGQGGVARSLRHLRLRTQRAYRHWRDASASQVFDVNVMLERIYPAFFALARRNVLIPNPEWFKPEYESHLGRLDRVLTKTHHAETIFDALGCRTEFIGFTSEDRLLAEVPREAAFFHLAGRSGNKGTRPLIDLWLREPTWPMLTVVQRDKLPSPLPAAANLRFVTRYVPDAELRALQNRYLFHLCPSETEGFGHHMVESMSVGAIVLTTDAPPMNEMIGPGRGILTAYCRTNTQHRATTYFVDPAALERDVRRMIALSGEERTTLATNAREWWSTNNLQFHGRLASAVESLFEG